MSRHINDKSLNLIKQFEGLRLKAYKLAGESYYTIGYGHSYGPSITANTVWTMEQATNALRSDLSKFEGYVEKYVTNVTLNDNQFGALVSYCYNRGLGKADGSNGLRQLIKHSSTLEDYANNLVVYWGTATRYKKGLLERRNAEKNLFLTPVGNNGSQNSSGVVTPSKERIMEVQRWLNTNYDSFFINLSVCGRRKLDVDGKVGNKTRAGITVALQLYLNELGYELDVDGKYGPKTNTACKKSIAVTRGDISTASKIVQIVLYMYGYPSESSMLHQQFTSADVDKLKQYQRDHRLVPDGIAGQAFFTSSIKQR